MDYKVGLRRSYTLAYDDIDGALKEALSEYTEEVNQ